MTKIYKIIKILKGHLNSSTEYILDDDMILNGAT